MYSTKTFEKLHELQTGTIRYLWCCLVQSVYVYCIDNFTIATSDNISMFYNSVYAVSKNVGQLIILKIQFIVYFNSVSKFCAVLL